MGFFGQNIAVLVNSVLLAFVYIFAVGPTSIAARLMKKRFLEARFSKSTYWSDLSLKKKKIDDYYRQF